MNENKNQILKKLDEFIKALEDEKFLSFKEELLKLKEKKDNDFFIEVKNFIEKEDFKNLKINDNWEKDIEDILNIINDSLKEEAKIQIEIQEESIEIKKEELQKEIPIIKKFDNFNFNTLPDDILNLGLKIINHPKLVLNYKETEKENEISIDTNLLNFCNYAIKKEISIKNFLDAFDDSENPKYENNTFFKDKNGNFTTTIFEQVCSNCEFSRCPKPIITYLKYLKEKGILNEKLKERESYLKERNINNFFLFEWNPPNGLKYVPENIYEIAKELVEKRYITVKRILNKNNVEINSLFSCSSLEKVNEKEDLELIENLKRKSFTTLKRSPKIEILGLNCSDFSCRKKACIILVAGYIYYLIKSGQEEKIEEDRKFFNENKEEVKQKLLNDYENKANELEEKETNLAKDFINEFSQIKNNIQNFDSLLNVLQSPYQKRLYCVIEAEKGLGQDKLIESILKALKTTNKIKKEILKEKEVHYIIETSLLSLATTLVYPIRDGASYEKLMYKNLKENRLYVIDNIKEFIASYNLFKDDTGKGSHNEFRKKQIYNIIDKLTLLKDNTFIILKGTKKEIESLFNLDIRFKYIFQECYLSINSLTIEELFEFYKKGLDLNLFYKLMNIGEDKVKDLFIEFVSLNRTLLPFKNLDLVNYLTMYSNSKNDIVFPENLYKKQTLDESLSGIIGLENVKLKVKEFEKYALFNSKALSLGLDMPRQNMHMIFTGNPGTGKTTIARIMARMLFDIGILKENKLIEVDRKDLIAIYSGQTAPKTMEVIEKALGGVLFIDEAYSLAPKGTDNLGQEAITTLIKAMEDKKDDIVVIFAGYKDEMKRFIDSNPGIASRIGYNFDFEDYTTNELLNMYTFKMNKMGFEIDEKSKEKLTIIFDYFKKKKAFGNGRFVDKVIQETLMNHSSNFKEELISKIDENDIPSIEKLNNEDITKKNISKIALKDIVGMDSLKKQIEDFESYVKFVELARKHNLSMPRQNMHMIFTGNPGTGKTTIARIMAKLLFDIGIIKENKLIEVDRKDLVAEFVGQTAPKTNEVIEKALGGVLFIDEAYSLAPSDSFRDFGQEAISTLIKAMEDKKDEFIVIFAGYKDEMKKFTDSNPGIASRIGYTFNFEDYTDIELYKIFEIKIEKLGFTIEEKASEKILTLMKFFVDVENIGNGRFVDKVVQEVLMNHSKNVTLENISIINEIDIPSIKEMMNVIFNGDNLLDPDKINEESIKRTAYHEIGHAFMHYYLFGSSNIKKITINAEGSGTLGKVIHTNGKDSLTHGKSFFLNRIKTLLAGMGSEEIFLEEFHNGNTSDLNNATLICHNMITHYGMSSLGIGQIKKQDGEMAILIQNETNSILNECFKETKKILKNNKANIEFLVNELLKRKELDGEEFNELLKQIK